MTIEEFQDAGDRLQNEYVARMMAGESFEQLEGELIRRQRELNERFVGEFSTTYPERCTTDAEKIRQIGKILRGERKRGAEWPAYPRVER